MRVFVLKVQSYRDGQVPLAVILTCPSSRNEAVSREPRFFNLRNILRSEASEKDWPQYSWSCLQPLSQRGYSEDSSGGVAWAAGPRPGAACCYQDNFKQCSFGVNPVYCNVCERLDSTRQLFGRFVNLPDWDLIGNTEVRFRPRLETSKFNTTNFCDNWQQLLFPVLQLIDCFLCFTADMIQRYEIHSYLSWLAALHFDNRFSNSFSKCILCKLFDLREDSSASPWTTETSACERC